MSEKYLGEYKNRFVAVLDVLGFSSMIKNSHSPENIRDIIKSLENDIFLICGRSPGQTIPNGRYPKCHPVMMSDTILIYSDDDSRESYKQIMAQSHMILMLSIGNALGVKLKSNGKKEFFTGSTYRPLRGAISHGEFYADRDSDIYFGPAFLDALEWEKAQNWIGMILTPECAKYCQQKGFSSDMLVEYDLSVIKSKFLKSKRQPAPRKKYIRRKGTDTDVYAYAPILMNRDDMEEVYKEGDEYVPCKDFKGAPVDTEPTVKKNECPDKISAIKWTTDSDFGVSLNSSYWENIRREDNKEEKKLKRMYKNTYNFHKYCKKMELDNSQLKGKISCKLHKQK